MLSFLFTNASLVMRLTLTASLLSLLLLTGCTAGMMTTEQARTLETGMSKQAVVDQYGKPLEINTTRTAERTRTQWVYRKADATKQVYLYFVGNRLDSIQY